MIGPDRSLPRVVFDTNVLLDFRVFDDPLARPLRAAFDAGRVVALRSADCDAELADVLARACFALDADLRSMLLAAWRTRAMPIAHVFPAPFACRDPRDQKFVELAVCARADALVSKDRALLALRRRAARVGLKIVAAAAAPAALGLAPDAGGV